jgi:NAD(P)-dependent dehydrogenase (short-subunit alcohol dehydrogenase family)
MQIKKQTDTATRWCSEQTGTSAEVKEALKTLKPVGRFGAQGEIARTALILASEASAFCTGAPFIVAGSSSPDSYQTGDKT